jgi:hypothetical protein
VDKHSARNAVPVAEGLPLDFQQGLVFASVDETGQNQKKIHEALKRACRKVRRIFLQSQPVN